MNIAVLHFAFLMYPGPSIFIIKHIDVLGIDLGTRDVMVKKDTWGRRSKFTNHIG